MATTLVTLHHDVLLPSVDNKHPLLHDIHLSTFILVRFICTGVHVGLPLPHWSSASELVAFKTDWYLQLVSSTAFPTIQGRPCYILMSDWPLRSRTSDTRMLISALPLSSICVQYMEISSGRLPGAAETCIIPDPGRSSEICTFDHFQVTALNVRWNQSKLF